MIRNDGNDIDDETFLKVIMPANDVVKKYFIDNYLYDYIAFSLATYYKMDAMWECRMEQEVNAAICSLCNFEDVELDYNKIKEILRTKHNLNVTSEKPLRIQEL